MDKIMPYVRPLIFIIFGTVIYIQDINGFVPAYAVLIGCYVYAAVRAYLIFKKQKEDTNKED
jgi:hypothetical protein